MCVGTGTSAGGGAGGFSCCAPVNATALEDGCARLAPVFGSIIACGWNLPVPAGERQRRDGDDRFRAGAALADRHPQRHAHFVRSHAHPLSRYAGWPSNRLRVAGHARALAAEQRRHHFALPGTIGGPRRRRLREHARTHGEAFAHRRSVASTPVSVSDAAGSPGASAGSGGSVIGVAYAVRQVRHERSQRERQRLRARGARMPSSPARRRLRPARSSRRCARRGRPAARSPARRPRP